jgi:hypothetical protein
MSRARVPAPKAFSGGEARGNKPLSRCSRSSPRSREPCCEDGGAEARHGCGLKAGAPPEPLAAPSVGGWLARIGGLKSEVVPSNPPTAVPKDQATGVTVSVATHNADEYNWSGFCCPYCSASGFVSCSGGHLACDATIESRNGRPFHQCFCGHAAFIGGIMKTLESKRLSVDREIASPKSPVPDAQHQNSRSADVALPPPTHGPLRKDKVARARRASRLRAV